MSKEPLKFNTVNTDDLNDKVLNHFKTKLFELNDEIIDLKLQDDEETLNNDKTDIEKLHGNWLIVNGNQIKSNKQSPNSTSEFIIDLF